MYNAGGQLIAEYHSDPVPPAAGGGGTSYLTSDHLGSTRVVTKADGTVKARYDYLPFGEELGSSVGGRTAEMGYSAADSTRQKFTQKERDNESGLDYFLARYYSSAQGRFTSVDPLATSARPSEPQTWNRYSYALNRPIIAIDPDGRAVILVFVGERARGGSGHATTQLLDKDGHYVRSSRGDGDSRYRSLGMAYERDPVNHPNAQHFDRAGNGNDTPFGVYTINRKSGGTEKSKLGDAYGTGKINLDAVEGDALANPQSPRTGIAIHGGGSMLKDPYATDQELKGTAGCVRLQNGDVNELIQSIDSLAKNGDAVTHVFIGTAEQIDEYAKAKDKNGNYKYPDLRIAQGYDQPPAR